ncbi:MAG: GntR family transcriptional regulator [Candidatus Omnitrophica bacterium]|nr:GntR family transcriptional regulator [Candidatus Omnitrophota bacterium]
MLLYQRVRNYLEKQIEKGKPGELLPSEYQLCRSLGVSRVTVRRAIKDLKEEGLILSYQGKGLFVLPQPQLRKKERVIRILFPVYDQPQDWFLLPLLQPIISHFSRHPYRIILAPFSLREISSSRLKDTAGLFWVAPYANQIGYLPRIRETGVPLVVLNRVIEKAGFSYVSTDHVASGKLAGEILISQGHRKVGYVGLIEESQPTVHRLAGLRLALAKEGITLKKNAVISLFLPVSFSRVTESTKKLLIEEKLTSLVVSGGSLLPACLKALRQTGLGLGQEIQVLTFDEAPEVEAETEASLTRIVQPLEEIGQEAVQAMLSLMGGETRPIRKVLSARIYEKEIVMK